MKEASREELLARISELEEESKQQAEIIGRSIDDNDKVVMEFRGKEVEYERRIAELEAELAMVAKNWFDGTYDDGRYIVVGLVEANNIRKVLSDTRKPLAVVKASIDTEMRTDGIRDLCNAFADEGCRVNGYKDCLVIVMPGEEADVRGPE